MKTHVSAVSAPSALPQGAYSHHWLVAAAAIGVVAIFALVALLLWMEQSPATVMQVIVEGGPVERFTEMAYLAVALAMWPLHRRTDAWTTTLALSIVMAAFGAREMDLHKAWTDISMLKLSFYAGNAPWMQKVVALLVLIPILIATVHLIRGHWRRVWMLVKAGHPVGITIATFLVTLVVSKCLDRAVNVLAEDYQVFVTFSTKALVSSFEEILEASLPVLAALGVVQQRVVKHPA